MEEVVGIEPIWYQGYTLVVSARWERIQLLSKHLRSNTCTAKKKPQTKPNNLAFIPGLKFLSRLLLRMKGPVSAALGAAVRPVRDFIALWWYLQQSSLCIPWGFGVLFWFDWYLVIIQTLESFRLLEHIWNKYCFSFGLAMFYPKHSEMQIFVVVWDNIHISLWLLPSCEQLAVDIACLHSGYWFYKPHGPCAAERTSWPALHSTCLAASSVPVLPGSAVLFGGFLRRTGVFLLLQFPPHMAYAKKQHIETLTWNAWCETSLKTGFSWVVIVAKLQGLEKAIWKRGQTWSCSCWEEQSPGTSSALSGSSVVKVLRSQQNGA